MEIPQHQHQKLFPVDVPFLSLWGRSTLKVLFGGNKFSVTPIIYISVMGVLRPDPILNEEPGRYLCQMPVNVLIISWKWHWIGQFKKRVMTPLLTTSCNRVYYLRVGRHTVNQEEYRYLWGSFHTYMVSFDSIIIVFVLVSVATDECEMVFRFQFGVYWVPIETV